MTIKTITKNKPWYGAGQIYGWAGAGVGINVDYLNKYDVIKVIVQNKKPYYITSSDVRQLCKEYMSYKLVENKDGTSSNVAVVPMFALKPNLSELEVGKNVVC